MANSRAVATDICLSKLQIRSTSHLTPALVYNSGLLGDEERTSSFLQSISRRSRPNESEPHLMVTVATDGPDPSDSRKPYNKHRQLKQSSWSMGGNGWSAQGWRTSPSEALARSWEEHKLTSQRSACLLHCARPGQTSWPHFPGKQSA